MPQSEPDKFGPTREEMIAQLAKTAARLAGFDPDGEITYREGDRVMYKGPAWQLQRFLDCAAAALVVLSGGCFDRTDQ